MRIKKETIVFTMPSLLLICIFMLIPVFQTLKMSLYSNIDGSVFVGLGNYIKILRDDQILNLNRLLDFAAPPYGAMVHNIIWILLHLPLSLILGLCLALLFQKARNVSFFKSFIFLGMVIPGVILGIIVQFLFGKSAGMISNLFALIGIPSLHTNWLSHPETALIALIITNIWTWTGYTMIVFFAALMTIPESYMEAARIDGASSIQRLMYIKIPLLKPSFRIITVMTIINIIKGFDMVYSSTGGGPGGASTVLGVEMYLNSFRYFKFGTGSAIATVLLILAGIPILVNVMESVKK